MEWFDCHECGSSFSVILDASSDDEISFCPCCGNSIEKEMDNSHGDEYDDPLDF